MKKTVFNILVVSLIIALFGIITISGLAMQAETQSTNKAEQTETLAVWKQAVNAELIRQGVIK